MIDSKMEKLIQGEICGEVRVIPLGEERYRLLLPLYRADGDGFAIILKRTSPDGWLLSDEASTLMHLGVNLAERAFEEGTRGKVLEGLNGRFGVENRNGELVKRIGRVENVGQAVFEFAQALLRLSNTDMLARTYTPSTFRDDFKAFITKTLPKWTFRRDWHSDRYDPEHIYTVDTWVNSREKPLLIFALNTDDRTRDATIAVQHYQKRGYEHTAVGVYDDIETKTGKVVRRFKDVSSFQYPSFENQKSPIAKLLLERADPIDE